MGLGFLSPLFLVGLAAAAVPILIHLFRRQAEPVVAFSAVRFLQRAPVEQARRRRLREWLLLALRTAALALLAIAFARPYLADTAAGQAAPVRVIAVDTSYSTSSPAQVARMRMHAADAVNRAPAGHLVALVRFDERAEVVVPPTGDRGLVRAAIARLEPSAAGTRFGAMLATVASIGAGRQSSVAVVSDLQALGWDQAGAGALPPNAPVEVLDVGGPPGNLAITSLSATSARVSVVVANGGAAPTSTEVTLSLDDQPLGRQSVQVPGGGSAEVAFAPPPRPGALRARITDPDGYAADDQRVQVLGARTRPRVVAITSRVDGGGEAFYLQRALEAAEGPEGMAVERLSAERLATDAARLDGAAVIVLLGSSGLDRRGGEAIGTAVSKGAGLLVAAGPALELARVAAQLPPALGVRAGRIETEEAGLTVAPVEVRHAVFRSFGSEPGLLAAARFRRVVRWDDGGQTLTLARFSNGAPALLEVRGAAGRVMLMASDLANAWNDFAVHPAFVPFAHDLVRYLAAARAEPAEYRVGQWPGPGGAVPGVVEVPARSGGVRRVAVNVDVREGSGARMGAEAFASAIPRRADADRGVAAIEVRQREQEQSLWRYGIVLMLVGLVLESVIGRRA